MDKKNHVYICIEFVRGVFLLRVTFTRSFAKILIQAFLAFNPLVLFKCLNLLILVLGQEDMKPVEILHWV